MEEEELKMEKWGWIKEIWGRRMEKELFRIKKWGWKAMDWGKAIKIWGFHHATPTFNTCILVHPLSRITLFWGHCKAQNFPLEDNLQLFPGLLYSAYWSKNIDNWSNFKGSRLDFSEFNFRNFKWSIYKLYILKNLWFLLKLLQKGYKKTFTGP